MEENQYTRDEPALLSYGSNPNRLVHNEMSLGTHDVNTKPKEIIIRSLDHGYFVKVGCQELAIESKEKITELLYRYLENPNKIEEIYFKNKKELF